MFDEYRNKVNKEESRTIAIDFDGVIHNDYKGFHDGTIYGNLIKGTKEAIELLANDYRIVIFSAKAKMDRPLVDGKSGSDLIIEFLIKYGIDKYISEVTAEKPRALAYIDDKAIEFNGNWNHVIEKLKKMI
tara:strand:- start:287 stop:679 length:393 start_codon:yes stop_codon:yes gene_type:complete